MCGQCGYECVGVSVEGWDLGEGKSVVFSECEYEGESQGDREGKFGCECVMMMLNMIRVVKTFDTRNSYTDSDTQSNPELFVVTITLTRTTELTLIEHAPTLTLTLTRVVTLTP